MGRFGALGLVLQFSLEQSAGTVIGTSSPTNHRRLVRGSDSSCALAAVPAAVEQRDTFWTTIHPCQDKVASLICGLTCHLQDCAQAGSRACGSAAAVFSFCSLMRFWFQRCLVLWSWQISLNGAVVSGHCMQGWVLRLQLIPTRVGFFLPVLRICQGFYFIFLLMRKYI